MLRCGGSVRFKNWNSITTDYNAIPTGASGQFKLEEIRAIKACITSDGLAYLGYFIILSILLIQSLFFRIDGLTDLKKIHFEKCDQLGDGMFKYTKLIINEFILGSISRLKQVKDTLESVALIDLAQITENGLGNLTDLKYVNYI